MWSLRKHDSRSRGILKGKWKMDDWEHFYDAGLTPNIIYNLNKLLDNYLARFAFAVVVCWCGFVAFGRTDLAAVCFLPCAPSALAATD